MNPHAAPTPTASASILTATPEQLVVMLYDGACASCPGRGRDARGHSAGRRAAPPRRGDHRRAARHARHGARGEIAERLQGIYVFCSAPHRGAPRAGRATRSTRSRAARRAARGLGRRSPPAAHEPPGREPSRSPSASARWPPTGRWTSSPPRRLERACAPRSSARAAGARLPLEAPAARAARCPRSSARTRRACARPARHAAVAPSSAALRRAPRRAGLRAHGSNVHTLTAVRLKAARPIRRYVSALKDEAKRRSKDGPPPTSFRRSRPVDLFDTTQLALERAMRGASQRQRRSRPTSRTPTRPATSATTWTSTARCGRPWQRRRRARRVEPSRPSDRHRPRHARRRQRRRHRPESAELAANGARVPGARRRSPRRASTSSSPRWACADGPLRRNRHLRAAASPPSACGWTSRPRTSPTPRPRAAPTARPYRRKEVVLQEARRFGASARRAIGATPAARPHGGVQVAGIVAGPDAPTARLRPGPPGRRRPGLRAMPERQPGHRDGRPDRRARAPTRRT